MIRLPDRRRQPSADRSHPAAPPPVGRLRPAEACRSNAVYWSPHDSDRGL